MYEIRIHSRGGQGGVTAARLIATAAFRDGKHATATPFYGAERRGAPIVAFARIDENPIRIYSQVTNPDLVVVLDRTLVPVVKVLKGLKPHGAVLVNSGHPVMLDHLKVHRVDLTGIALDEDLVIAGEPVLDTPVLGAIARLGVVSLESVTKAIAEMFADPRNVTAAERAYREVVL
ncbi:MAG TPA: 2-oxoacid:acceptor oxidoreductase family protein [Methanomicrobiales archaeon]|jgi:pyruvate ferredoxin oxidoreductase gamma subunit|nr:2-oxoacid:acceptor oxidoreductase family protein [Methanomicrobiales archaeon]